MISEFLNTILTPILKNIYRKEIIQIVNSNISCDSLPLHILDIICKSKDLAGAI